MMRVTTTRLPGTQASLSVMAATGTASMAASSWAGTAACCCGTQIACWRGLLQCSINAADHASSSQLCRCVSWS